MLKKSQFLILSLLLLACGGVVGATESSGVVAQLLNPALCQSEFSKSPAASGGCRLGGVGFQNGICAFGATCVRPDGSEQYNQLSTALDNMSLFRNCAGRLGFICD